MNLICFTFKYSSDLFFPPHNRTPDDPDKGRFQNRQNSGFLSVIFSPVSSGNELAWALARGFWLEVGNGSKMYLYMIENSKKKIKNLQF